MTKTPQDLIDALRSGKYKRGERRLFNSEGRHCCLGVAASEAGIPANALIHIGMPARLASEHQRAFEDAYPWLTDSLQTRLALANDNAKGDRYQKTINILKKVTP